ncbi:TasA family protein [Symbiobacterium thermophilum]|uniref:Spore coat protein n=1 Tax=Symbiobacterium thermophilum (strain DSM 24528 / JCM 14929 / IAM 14863 / T) TaxID=292459 RepID=Q67Q77_SYMTH|nr:TasA family protein [Symbiobacterium thermophilum]BAD40166.1 spore coat protein [Symbiobacterium thermophilum IAM 14863]
MKRILLSLATVGALSALVTGATFALFTASTENTNNTFTAGTVRFGKDFNASCDLSADNIAPGDSGSCSYTITYVGSLEAFVGVEHSVSGDLFSGDNPMTYTVNGKSDSGTILLGKASNGDTVTADVQWSFPLAAGDEYEGKSGTISLTFKAVQVRNNEDASGNPISWNEDGT